jgi:hypothetical protein
MGLPTEPIGSIPRPLELVQAIGPDGDGTDPALEPLYEAAIRRYMKPHHTVFVGVVNPIDPRIETPEEVRERVLEAASYIPLAQLGTTDDCGFSPFSDDSSTSRATTFAKIRARIAGTRLADGMLGAH